MAPTATICFITTARLPLLLALIHKAIAPRIVLPDDGAALCQIGWQHYDDGDPEAALEMFQTLLIAAQQAQNVDKMATALNAIAFIYMENYQSEPIPAPVPATLAADEDREDADSVPSSTKLLGLAIYHQVTADLDQALIYYQQALYHATQQQRLTQMGLCLNGMGLVYRKLRNYERSHTHTQTAVQIFSESGDRAYLAAALHNLGIVCCHLQEYTRALQHFSQASTIRAQLQDSLGESTSLACMGQVHFHRQEYMFALASYQAALEACRESDQATDTTQEEALLLSQIASLCEKMNRQDLAIAHYSEALKKLSPTQNSELTTRLQRQLRRLYEGLDDDDIDPPGTDQTGGKGNAPDQLSEVLEAVECALGG